MPFWKSGSYQLPKLKNTHMELQNSPSTEQTSFSENVPKKAEREVLVETQSKPSDKKKFNAVKWPWASKKTEKMSRNFVATFLACLLFLLTVIAIVIYFALVRSNPTSANPETVTVYHLPAKSDNRPRLLMAATSDDSEEETTTTTSTTHSPVAEHSEESEESAEVTEPTEKEELEVTTVFVPRSTEKVPSSTTQLKFYETLDGDNTETCLGRHALGSPSGVYIIESGDKFKAYCDMDTTDGGWTVIQRRTDADGAFHRATMKQFEEGFGSLRGNHWLGLSKLHQLAPVGSKPATLRIEIEGDSCNSDCSKRYAHTLIGEWKVSVGNRATGYQIEIAGPGIGNLTEDNNDSFYEGSNNNKFSAPDFDQDGSAFINCAQFRMLGAWWHGDKCSDVALNGYYQTIAEKYNTKDRNQSQKRYFLWAFKKPVDGAPLVLHLRKSRMLLKTNF